jgi:4-hydroxybenzoate polyprenyltransferase
MVRVDNRLADLESHMVLSPSRDQGNTPSKERPSRLCWSDGKQGLDKHVVACFTAFSSSPGGTPDTGRVGIGRNRRRAVSAARALLLACHPLPTAAVTTLTMVLAAAAGTRGPVLVVLAAAVLSGQLCVGWVNDLVDSDRDRAVGRTDKPLALGRVSAGAIRRAAVVAGLACVPLSLGLGAAPGAAHLTAVAGALAYDVGLKRTAWSWVPFAVGFGLLPVVVWLVSPHRELPPAWLIIAGSLLGVGAHGANVLPDHARDRATGVLGLPQRLTIPVLRAGTAAALLASVALLTLGPAGAPHVWEWAAFGASGVFACLSVADVGNGRSSFPAAIGVGAVAVTILVLRGALG